MSESSPSELIVTYELSAPSTLQVTDSLALTEPKELVFSSISLFTELVKIGAASATLISIKDVVVALSYESVALILNLYDDCV